MDFGSLTKGAIRTKDKANIIACPTLRYFRSYTIRLRRWIIRIQVSSPQNILFRFDLNATPLPTCPPKVMPTALKVTFFYGKTAKRDKNLTQMNTCVKVKNNRSVAIFGNKDGQRTKKVW